MGSERVQTQPVEPDEDMLSWFPGYGCGDFYLDEVRREGGQGCVVEALDVGSYLACKEARDVYCTCGDEVVPSIVR